MKKKYVRWSYFVCDLDPIGTKQLKQSTSSFSKMTQNDRRGSADDISRGGTVNHDSSTKGLSRLSNTHDHPHAPWNRIIFECSPTSSLVYDHCYCYSYKLFNIVFFMKKCSYLMSPPSTWVDAMTFDAKTHTWNTKTLFKWPWKFLTKNSRWDIVTFFVQMLLSRSYSSLFKSF